MGEEPGGNVIRVVPTGDLGLDVLLGGGWRLVKRFEDRESATIVVRGGSGAGKTLMGIQVALELAKALGGDVAVGCVEILPTEYVAQLQSARPSLAPERVAMLPVQPSATAGDEPRVYVALLNDLSPEKPDLVTALEGLDATVKAAGGKPVAFIVDSLIEGYGLGASTPRIDADDVLKFAARYGYALVLCEEVVADETSPWVFAADTVLQLGVESRERGRWIEVRKHRFGPSATGRHELFLAGRRGPAVIPAVHAWTSQAVFARRVLGLNISAQAIEPTQLQWPDAPPLTGGLITISAQSHFLAERLALTLAPQRGQSLVLELDPLATGPAAVRPPPPAARAASIPTSLGVDRAFRWMVEEIASTIDATGELAIDRLIVTDLQILTAMPSWDAWLGAIRALSQLFAGFSAPVIACISHPEDRFRRERLIEQLACYSDSIVTLEVLPSGATGNTTTTTIVDTATRVSVLVELPVGPR